MARPRTRPTITENDEGTWDGACVVEGCDYTSVRHATRKAAQTRMTEHVTEHGQTTDDTDEDAD